MRTISDLVNPWIKGLPVYEPGRPIEKVARDLGFANSDDIIKLASNENSLGPSPLAVKAMKKAAARMHLYPDGGGFFLRSALSEKLDVPVSMILPGNGSNELIELLIRAFVSEGRGIVMADGSFVIYKLITKAVRGSIVAVPMRDFKHDLDAMLEAIKPETSLVFIANPNNPSGTMVGRAELDNFMERVPDHVVVCFDEAYIELIDQSLNPDAIRYVREGKKAIVLRTFSKTYGLAGLRLGYAIGPDDLLGLMAQIRQPFSVNAMAMEAAVAALDDVKYLERTRRMLKKGLAFFYKQCKALNLEYVPSVANFVLIKTGNGREVFEQMMKEGVIVRPMDGYNLPDYIRVTVGTHSENIKCFEVLKRVLGL